jgi:hypothetical protein
MHELYVEKIDKSDAADKIDDTIHKGVCSNPITSQKMGNLGLENKKCAENLGKNDLGCSDKKEIDDSGHNKSVDDPVIKSVENVVDEENDVDDAAVSNVETNLETTVVAESSGMAVGSDKQKASDTTTIMNVSKENAGVHSHSDEGLETCTENTYVEKSVEQNKDTNVGAIDVDNLTAGESPIAKTSGPSIAKRLRSNSGKAVVIEESVSVKAGKKVKNPVRYGRPRPPTEPLTLSGKGKRSVKRKEVSTDSDFEEDADATTVATSSSKKTAGKKKTPQGVPSVPIDNISFHHVENVSRWKYVYQRRLAIERNLSEDLLKCEEIVSLIEHDGLMKIVTGFGNYYEQLVKEFLVNIAEDCDDPKSPEYRKVYVRGKCVDFSSDVINLHLGRSTNMIMPLKVSMNEVCNLVKAWPTKSNLSSSKLTAKYALLNKVAAANWAPTTHSNVVATGLAKIIYAVGTKTAFDYGGVHI